MGVRVSCNQVSKIFRATSGQLAKALVDVRFQVANEEFLVVVGPSGSGKTTLLQIIAGIERPSSGTVTFESAGPTLQIGMVFQTNSIFPWRTVERNLTYALEAAGIKLTEQRLEAENLCRLVGLDPGAYLKKYPKELSGGETRRIAIGMALSTKANLLLFDEPTSQLDYLAKLKLSETVQKTWHERRFSAIYVTHDIDEGILLADRVIILDKGRIKAEAKVPLARPRNAEVLASGEFAMIRREILRSFES
jgi:NitT/TauT family transport system ATP-binding protein